MSISPGHIVFLVAPLILAAVLLRLDPSARRVRLRSLLLYVVIMSAVILGALELVAYVASGHVRYSEILVILWFTITWRLAWAIWVRTVGRLGQARLRWARWRRSQGLPAPRLIRLIHLDAHV